MVDEAVYIAKLTWLVEHMDSDKTYEGTYKLGRKYEVSSENIRYWITQGIAISGHTLDSRMCVANDIYAGYIVDI